MDKLFNAARFGEKLKKYRLKKHLSQMELAEKIDLQTSSVSHLENGTREFDSLIFQKIPTGLI